MTDMDVAYWMAKYDQLKEDYADLNCHYAAALDKINELEDRWISVDDRLPEKDGSYLIAMYHRLMVGGIYKTYTARFVASFNAEYKEWTVMGEVCTTVTHWMNLPDFPEE